MPKKKRAAAPVAGTPRQLTQYLELVAALKRQGFRQLTDGTWRRRTEPHGNRFAIVEHEGRMHLRLHQAKQQKRRAPADDEDED